MHRHSLRLICSLALIALPVAAYGAACLPQFPLEHAGARGWEGADAAYSIPLPDGREVWIFGDTLFGEKRVVAGHDPRQVHNSLGISTCTADGMWNLHYVVKHDAKGEAASYFSPKDPAHWYWAMDGFYAKGDLWVTLLCIRHAAKPAPWAMDFETCGADLAQISHLDRDPQDWSVQVRPLVADGVKAYPSASAVVEGNYAYIFALYEAGTRPLLATRIPLNGLSEPARNLQYLAADGDWKPGFAPSNARPIMDPGITELSIRYHPAMHRWVAVMFEPTMFSDKIIFRTAPSLIGPWTAGSVIYHVPEMQAGPQRDKNTFCYAGKEHPEFEEQGQLLFTYVCNTMDVPSLVTNEHIYFPQVVSMRMPD